MVNRVVVFMLLQWNPYTVDTIGAKKKQNKKQQQQQNNKKTVRFRGMSVLDLVLDQILTIEKLLYYSLWV